MFVELGSASFEVEDGRERGFDVTIHVSPANENVHSAVRNGCLLYTSDAADE